MKKEFYILKQKDNYSYTTELTEDIKNNVVFTGCVNEKFVKLYANKKIGELKLAEGLIEDLPEHFIGKGEVKGFLFDLIYKDEEFYIYQVEQNYYEIFDKKFNGNKVKYPTGEDFGEWAWTFTKITPMIKFIRGHYGKQLDPSIFE